jgi:hypothetical protein
MSLSHDCVEMREEIKAVDENRYHVFHGKFLHEDMQSVPLIVKILTASIFWDLIPSSPLKVI